MKNIYGLAKEFFLGKNDLSNTEVALPEIMINKVKAKQKLEKNLNKKTPQ